MKIKSLQIVFYLILAGYASAQSSQNYLQALLTEGYKQIGKNDCDHARSALKAYQITRGNDPAKARDLSLMISEVQKKRSCKTHGEIDSGSMDDLPRVPGGVRHDYVIKGNDAFNNGNYSLAAENFFKYIIANSSYFDQHDDDAEAYYRRIDESLSRTKE
jgi:hypothetical protein